MKDGFIRVACATPDIITADCGHNSSAVIGMIDNADSNSASVILFPELCVTGAVCGDLFLQDALLEGAENALYDIIESTAGKNIVAVVGAPLRNGSALYNCTVIIRDGNILGVVPKKALSPSERRCFSSGVGTDGAQGNIASKTPYVFSESGVFACENIPELALGVLTGEDEPTDGYKAATMILRASSEAEIVGAAEYRRADAKVFSKKNICCYMRSGAGVGESTTDAVYSGHNIIAEDGDILSESTLFENGIVYAEADVKKIAHERRKSEKFSAPCRECAQSFMLDEVCLELGRNIPKSPFIPQDKSALAERCGVVLRIQATGLASRMKRIGCKSAVIGLSGGLDSTLALIVTVRAFDILGLDRKNILTVTMPHSGCTTKRTKSNAVSLAEEYGVALEEIDITAAVKQHFADISLDANDKGAAFENSQARERTQILMDIANKIGGIVVGTGDLSELALGWATYNGDHMSMYGVNASVPKTLVRHLVSYEAENCGGALGDVLRDILGTPVSPELLPFENDEISQKTEDLVGPYELHDFFLYYLARYGFTPSKILRIAEKAFEGEFDSETIKKWLTVFVKRFFSQQFKRSCLPDGPSVGTLSLSPRGGLDMPSDASAALWLKNLED